MPNFIRHLIRRHKMILIISALHGSISFSSKTLRCWAWLQVFTSKYWYRIITLRAYDISYIQQPIPQPSPPQQNGHYWHTPIGHDTILASRANYRLSAVYMTISTISLFPPRFFSSIAHILQQYTMLRDKRDCWLMLMTYHSLISFAEMRWCQVWRLMYMIFIMPGRWFW